MRDLHPAELTVADQVLGLYTLAGLGAPPGADVVTVGTLSSGPGLVVPPPEGDDVHDPDVATRFGRHLFDLLGDPWQIAGNQLRLADGMLAPDRRAAYGVRSDVGPVGWVAVGHDTWICQAVLAPSVLAVALVRLMGEDEALEAPGTPAYRPLGDVAALLSELAPAVPIGADQSAQAQRNVFDTVLVADSVRVRSGIRARLTTGMDPVGGPLPYCYVVRIDATGRSGAQR